MQATAATRQAQFQPNMEAARRFADITVGGIERVAQLEMKAARDWLFLTQEQFVSLLADGSDNAGETGWPVLMPALLQRSGRAALNFNKACLDIAATTQAELSKVAAEQAAALSETWLGASTAAHGARR